MCGNKLTARLPLTPREGKKTITGVFGGSFNPLHNGHIALAKALLERTGLDDIMFVVSPHNPLKTAGTLLDDDTRLQMVCEALKNEPRLEASDCEFRLPRPSFMRNTLAAISSGHPDREFVLLIGADNWACFDRWFAHKEIIDNYRIIIYPRGGSPLNGGLLPQGVTLADTPLLDISSTEIRRRIALGRPFEELVPAVVAQRIKREGLYGYGINARGKRQ